MTKRRFSALACAITSTVCITLGMQAATTRADDTKPATMPAMSAMPGMTPEMQQRMAEISQPGPMHESLKRMVGKWDVELWSKMTPDAPEETTQGEATVSMTLGGRWAEERLTGTTMGQPFEDHGFIGYDTVRKQYVSFFMSTMCTMANAMYGDSSDDGKTVTYKVEMDDPMTPGAKVKMRVVTKDLGDDKATVEFFEDHGQGEYKSMAMTYTRAK